MVVDLMLPDGDGAELVAEIKSRRPGLPVVVLSANDDLSGALEAGADVAMNKSMSLPEIATALCRFTGRTEHPKHGSLFMRGAVVSGIAAV